MVTGRCWWRLFSILGLNAHRCQKSHNAIGVRNDLRSGLRWPERSNCLRYIDQVELRQAIEKQLNRIELANSFTRAVALGNPRGLEYAGKSEQEIAKSCNRLIKNRTICWNYLYLTRQIEAPRTPEEQDRLQRMISLHSAQSWAHFNMLGEYDFSNDPDNRESPNR